MQAQCHRCRTALIGASDNVLTTRQARCGAGHVFGLVVWRRAVGGELRDRDVKMQGLQEELNLRPVLPHRHWKTDVRQVAYEQSAPRSAKQI
jgi:hypothetical protein